jgi:ribosomal protein S18 acetylase RimI-like enzyme
MITVVQRRDPVAVEALLRALPQWFGIEQSIVEYVESAQHLPTYLAVENDAVVGCALVVRHFRSAAEVSLMAVAPSHHRRGIGRRLLTVAEDSLRDQDARWLQVKTLGPARPNEHYARTRAFYHAMGFEPLEEMHGIWQGNNPCLLMVKQLDPASGRLP